MADEQKQMVRVEVIAQLFELSVEQIYRLTKSGIIKSQKVEGESGRMYPFIESIQGYIRHLKDADAKKNQISDALKEADLAMKELKAREFEARVGLAEGNLHRSEDVRRVMNDMLGSFKMRLHSIPHTLSDRLVNVSSKDDVADILREEIIGLCNILVRYNADEFYSRNSDLLIEEEAEMSEEPSLEETD